MYLRENSFSVHCVLTWEHFLGALCTYLRTLSQCIMHQPENITKLVKLYVSARCTYVRTFFRLSMACSNFSLSQCVLGVFFKISENIPKTFNPMNYPRLLDCIAAFYWLLTHMCACACTRVCACISFYVLLLFQGERNSPTLTQQRHHVPTTAILAPKL